MKISLILTFCRCFYFFIFFAFKKRNNENPLPEKITHEVQLRH